MKVAFNLITLSLFFCLPFISAGQKIRYSLPESYAIISKFNIIGQVKDDILIWKTPDGKPKKSEIIIYDKDMHVKKHVKTHILQYGEQYNVAFINRNDSFEVIYQYLNKGVYFCKRAVFNEVGKCINFQAIDSISAEAGTGLNDYTYNIITSKDKKTFALVKFISASPGVIDIDYRYFGFDNMHSGSQHLPFYVNTSSINSLMLNEDGNLFLALSKQESQIYTLTMYRINLNNNHTINSLKQLNYGSLMNESFTISEYHGNYTVCAGFEADSTKGIFLWHLNADLEDIQPDTVITNKFIQDSVFKKTKNFQIIGYENKNRMNLFIKSVNKPVKDSVLLSRKYNSNVLFNILYSQQRYYFGFNDFLTNGTYDYVETVIPTAKPNPEDLRLFSIVLEKQKDVKSVECFTGELDKETTSLINNATIFQSTTGFNILFDQYHGNKKTTGYIVLTNDNRFKYAHLIVMNLKYHLLIDKAVSIDPNNIIAPCSYKNKMVFARITLN
ncbi:MAG: hypothetical protein ACTHLB_03900 [Parafilimonas sp.]